MRLFAFAAHRSMLFIHRREFVVASRKNRSLCRLGVLLSITTMLLCVTPALADDGKALLVSPASPPPDRVGTTTLTQEVVVVNPAPVVLVTPATYPVAVPVEPRERLLTFGGGFRLSVGIPGGSVVQNAKLSNVASLLYNLEGQTDLVIASRLSLGVHVGIGVASLADDFSQNCQANGVSCTLLDFTLGAHAEFTPFGRRARVKPWVGIGVSYEDLILSESFDSVSTSGSFNGVDLDASLGVDVKLGPFGLGPFVTYRTGKYSSVSADSLGATTADIQQTTWHDWVMIGLRGRY
jgi:hypothetical protein